MIEVAVRVAAGEHLGALRARVLDQLDDALARAVVDHRADHRALVARVADRRACPPARPAWTPSSAATERSATIRSVDMQIWPEFMNAPKLAASAAASRSASASTTSGALPPSSSRQRLRCSAHFSAMILPTSSRAGEVHAPHRRMGDQLVDHVGRVLGRVDDQVDRAGRQPGVDERAHDRGVRARALLGRLQHDRVAVGQRRRDRARGEDHRRVPRRHPDHHAGGLAHAHRERAGHVGRDHLADDGVGLRRRLAQHPRREVAVEHAPPERAADLLGHDRRRCRARRSISRSAARLSSVRRSPARGTRPAGERVARRLDRPPRVLAPRRRRDRHGLAREAGRCARTCRRPRPPPTRRRSAVAAARDQPSSSAPPPVS